MNHLIQINYMSHSADMYDKKCKMEKKSILTYILNYNDLDKATLHDDKFWKTLSKSILTHKSYHALKSLFFKVIQKEIIYGAKMYDLTEDESKQIQKLVLSESNEDVRLDSLHGFPKDTFSDLIKQHKATMSKPGIKRTSKSKNMKDKKSRNRNMILDASSSEDESIIRKRDTNAAIISLNQSKLRKKRVVMRKLNSSSSEENDSELQERDQNDGNLSLAEIMKLYGNEVLPHRPLFDPKFKIFARKREPIDNFLKRLGPRGTHLSPPRIGNESIHANKENNLENLSDAINEVIVQDVPVVPKPAFVIEASIKTNEMNVESFANCESAPYSSIGPEISKVFGTQDSLINYFKNPEAVDQNDIDNNVQTSAVNINEPNELVVPPSILKKQRSILKKPTIAMSSSMKNTFEEYKIDVDDTPPQWHNTAVIKQKYSNQVSEILNPLQIIRKTVVDPTGRKRSQQPSKDEVSHTVKIFKDKLKNSAKNTEDNIRQELAPVTKPVSSTFGLTSKENIVIVQPGKRHRFSAEESQSVLDLMLADSRYKNAKDPLTWKAVYVEFKTRNLHLENSKKIEMIDHATLKRHYLNAIVPNLEKYKLDLKLIKPIRLYANKM